MNELKVCSKCKIPQPLDQFVKSDAYKDKLYPICKTCRKATRAAGLLKKTLCITCGVNPHSINSPYCEPCQRIARGRDPVAKYHPRKDGICPRCGVNPKAKDYGYCEECRAEYNAEWFKGKGGKWNYLSPEAKNRSTARSMVWTYVQRGKLEKWPCEICGALESEAHHYAGYEREHWFTVLWVCNQHHRDCHSEKIKVDVHDGGVVVVTIGAADHLPKISASGYQPS